MEDIQIIDNFIPLKYQEKIYDTVTSLQFPWYPVYEFSSEGYRLTFCHFLCNDGPYNEPGSMCSSYNSLFLPILYQIVDKLNVKLVKILRIRVGLVTNNLFSSKKENASYEYSGDSPHQDFFIPHMTALYYVNSADGDTIIYNEQDLTDKFTLKTNVTPKQGRVCAFNGKSFHSAGTPIKYSQRIVVTFNFTYEKNI